jgi:ribokinase
MPDLGKQVITKDFQTHGGGCSANFAMQCARLGMDIQLFGKVGDDVFGTFVLVELEDNKVDTKNVLLTDRKTGVTVAMVQGIYRSFVTFRGENATYTIKDIDLTKIEADLVHLPSYFLLDGLRYDYGHLIDLLHARESKSRSIPAGTRGASRRKRWSRSTRSSPRSTSSCPTSTRPGKSWATTA